MLLLLDWRHEVPLYERSCGKARAKSIQSSDSMNVRSVCYTYASFLLCLLWQKSFFCVTEYNFIYWFPIMLLLLFCLVFFASCCGVQPTKLKLLPLIPIYINVRQAK